MQILKRNNGIDLKASNSHLIGNAKIVLSDAITGKITDVIEKKNTFTTALNSLFNAVPYNLNKGSLYNASTGYADGMDYQTPLYQKALGGIMLFPQSLGSDLNDYYPSFDSNYPTGYASMAEYVQQDSRQGVFDAVSSGEITNGYRWVYSWGSSFGNGAIGAVALSNVKCYKYFNDFATMLGLGASTSYYPIGTGINVGSINDCTVIGCNARGWYYRSSSNKIYFIPIPVEKISLMENYRNVYNDVTELNYTIPANSLLYLTDDEIHIFTITSSTAESSSVTHTILDLDDETTSSTTFTVAAYLDLGNYMSNTTCVIRDGYLYIKKAGASSSGGSIYKINLSNVADVDELETTVDMTYTCGLWNVGGIIYSINFLIADDDTIRAVSGDNGQIPVYRKGVYVMRCAAPVCSMFSRVYTGAGVDVLTPYCATKANLDNIVTKDASKQMIVNYSVTQV